MDSGNPTDVDKLNPKWAYEPFTVVADGGIGEVALYNTYHKRFWRMAGNDMVRSDEMEKLGPPPQHSWLRFKPKLVMSKADADKAAIAIAKPPPFADSAALRTAVDNCLAAVPSGLDCCKPKSEGGGGADCGAGGHAAIGDWDVSQVTSMEGRKREFGLFDGRVVGKEFNQDLSKWDVSKVTNMQYMFFHSGFDQDITGWNTASLPNDRASYRMFTGDSAWYRKYGRAGWSSGDMNGPPSAWHKKA